MIRTFVKIEHHQKCAAVAGVYVLEIDRIDINIRILCCHGASVTGTADALSVKDNVIQP